jgi:PilZ domain/Gram-negative bacterial TonB protein C-terminal
MAQTAQPLSAEPTTIERRFYPRIVPPAPIYISMGEANPCRVLNASENGLLLSTPTEFLSNFVARIALPLNGLSKPAVVNIHVLWAIKTRQLAGVQFLDLSDHDRQQIRKWGSYGSSTLLHRDTLHEPGREPNQLLISAKPSPAEKPKRESAFTPKPSLNNPVVAQSTSPSPAVMRRQSTSPIASITRWAMLLAVLCLVGAFLLRSGAMEHSFARSTAVRHASAIAPPATNESHPNLQSPDSDVGIADGDVGSPSLVANAAKSRKDFSLPTTVQNSQAGAAGRDHLPTLNIPIDTAQKPRKSPRAASTFPATPRFERDPNPHSVGSNSDNPISVNTLRVAVPADAPAMPNSIAGTAESAAQVPETSAIPITISSTTKEPTSNATHSNDVAPSASKTLSSGSNVAPVPSVPAASLHSYATLLVQPVVQMDPLPRQVMEIHIPSGYRVPFFNVPNESVLESSFVTMRIQRSVRLPSANPHWPFHRNTRIVVGGLISRIDPQAAPGRAGTSEYVRVQATVAQDGRVESVRPISGSGNLIPTVRKAVQGWRYQPTLVDGKPVETRADVLIQFHPSPPRSALPGRQGTDPSLGQTDR